MTQVLSDAKEEVQVAVRSHSGWVSNLEGKFQIEYFEGFVSGLETNALIKLMSAVERESMKRGVGRYAGTGGDPGDEQA